MADTREDEHPDRRRRRTHDDHRSDSRRHEHREGRKDSPRRRSSRSPTSRTSNKTDYERRHRERPERRDSPADDDRRRDRHRSPGGRSHRKHRDQDRDRDRNRDHDRDRGSHKHKEKPSRRRRGYSRSRSPGRRSHTPSSSHALARSKGPLPSQQDAYKIDVSRDGDPSSTPLPEKEKPNFGNTGRLAAESNTVNVNGDTVVLKYHEPPEARKPPAKDSWRLYVFKGEELLEMVELNERSCWLIGRERLVVDFPLDHPSCSKQHAAVQFRFVEKKNEFGDRVGKVKPYLIDLESANGSTVNGDSVPGGRYVEIRDKDVLRFGLSSREYVLMLTQPD